MAKTTHHLTDIEATTDLILKQLGNAVNVATPLGLGKPNQLLNSIYRRAKTENNLFLNIHTALSLEIPRAKSPLEKKFLNPFVKNHFGENYPELDYVNDLHNNKLQKNISIHEFYLQAASMLYNETAQRNYISLNYTHVAQSVLEEGVNLIVQLIAKKEIEGKVCYSLSCNPDLTLDVYDLCKKKNKKLMMVGVIHPDLPFMGHDAQVSEDFFDIILDTPTVNHKLFALPRPAITESDYFIGFYASQIVKDDGTLQIGIGSLSDALTYCLLLRHQKNAIYKNIAEQLWNQRPHPFTLHNTSFEKGLYGTSEMVMDGFMHLRKANILVRQVQDYVDAPYRFLHGAFFLGSKELYKWLSNLSPKDYDGLCMTRVSKVNDLYDEDEMILRKQRKNARFFNTCMNVTLLGGAASETLENGQVVSGVGGQYNFVAMSHELPDSYSVLMLKSFRFANGKKTSNIVWSHGHITIPRHLRDVVVTEYGIAYLRGKSDEEVIKALICIADSDFQEELCQIAKGYGKLSKDYQVPIWAKNNSPQALKGVLKAHKAQNIFPQFPFGSDFTLVEQKLVSALTRLKKVTSSKLQIVPLLIKGLSVNKEKFKAELERMDLYAPKSFEDRIYQKLLLATL